MFKKRRGIVFVLFAVFVIGLFLRIFQLEQFPVGFHVDEASKGYTAFSLLLTGRDDNNTAFPLYIDIFGDNSPSGYHIITILPVALLGLTEWAVRIPGAIIGALSILACYFLAYAIFKNTTISIVSSVLMAIAPWHINLSRASSESVVALFFIVIGFTSIIWSLRIQSSKYVYWGAGIASISFFFYQTPRLFVPLLFLVSGVYFLKFAKIQFTTQYKKAFFLSFFLVALLDVLLIFGVPGGSGRFSQVNIFSHPDTQLVLEEQIREDGVLQNSVFLTRFFHNKIINNTLSYLSNYLEYFSWNFLFLKNLPAWYFVPNMGVHYLIELPFIVVGLFMIVFHKDKIFKFPLLWLLLAPTAAATAVDINNLQRALVLLVILELIAAYGLVYLVQKVKKHRQLVVGVLLLFFILNISYFLHQYFSHTQVHRPWYRNSGFKEMVHTIRKSYDSYDKIIVTKSAGGIYPLVQFYMEYDPKIYQEEGSPKDKDYKGFGKFIFVPVECPSIKRTSLFPQSGRIIYVNNGICPQDERYKEQIIYREDKTQAFRIVYAPEEVNTFLEQKIED